MSSRGIRRGLTLPEVVFLLAVGAVLLAIALPLVQRARESARRGECAGKLKQLALALLSYHDVHRKFPATSNQGNTGGVASVWWPLPGSAADTGASPSIGYTTAAGTTSATAGYSWIVRILPHLQESELYDAIAEASSDFQADAFTPFDVGATAGGQQFSISRVENGTAVRKHFAAVRLDQLICPDYPGPWSVRPSQYAGSPSGDPPASYGYPSGGDKLGSPAQSAAITNYVALSATHFPCMQYGEEENLAATTEIPVGAEAPNGTIIPGNGLNLRTVTDGSSHTLLLCETVEPAMNSWYDGTTAWTTGLDPNMVSSSPPVIKLLEPVCRWDVPKGVAVALNLGPVPRQDVAYSPAIAGYCAAPQVISWGPSSNHTGGVVLHVTANASVHEISPDVDPGIYLELITRTGRETEIIAPDLIP